jgi:hypothetical protein
MVLCSICNIPYDHYHHTLYGEPVYICTCPVHKHIPDPIDKSPIENKETQ